MLFSLISTKAGSLSQKALPIGGVLLVAAVVAGCEAEPTAEFDCRREFAPAAQVEACKTGMQYAHHFGNDSDANKECADRYDLSSVDLEEATKEEVAFEDAFRLANLFHACTHGAKAYLEFQDPVAREKILAERGFVASADDFEGAGGAGSGAELGGSHGAAGMDETGTAVGDYCVDLAEGVMRPCHSK